MVDDSGKETVILINGQSLGYTAAVCSILDKCKMHYQHMNSGTKKNRAIGLLVWKEDYDKAVAILQRELPKKLQKKELNDAQRKVIYALSILVVVYFIVRLAMRYIG